MADQPKEKRLKQAAADLEAAAHRLSVIAQEPETASERRIAAMERAGTLMSNVLYNLAQNANLANAHDRKLCDSMRRQWDEAVRLDQGG